MAEAEAEAGTMVAVAMVVADTMAAVAMVVADTMAVGMAGTMAAGTIMALATIMEDWA
jgi:hypothetical protein